MIVLLRQIKTCTMPGGIGLFNLQKYAEIRDVWLVYDLNTPLNHRNDDSIFLKLPGFSQLI